MLRRRRRLEATRFAGFEDRADAMPKLLSRSEEEARFTSVAADSDSASLLLLSAVSLVSNGISNLPFP